MSRKKKVWTHKRYGKREYDGHYGIARVDGQLCERAFILSAWRTPNHVHQVSFESHEAAKKLGWIAK